MDTGRYLPSKQFSLITISLFLSAGLVFAAEHIHKPSTGSLAVDTTGAAPAGAGDWKASLESVQQNSGISLPSAPDQNTVEGLLQAAQSNNLTESVSRSLFVNLVNAKGQGLGSDIPTQDQIVTQALSQVPASIRTKTYFTEDLTLTDTSKTSLHAYGNAVMTVLQKNSNQEYAKTLVIIDAVTTKNDATQLELLKPIQKTYKHISNELIAIPVPKILAPFHLQLVNDFENITATYDKFEALVGDPLNGIAAIQQYRTLTQDAGQMFINIAQTFQKNDIIFNKDEPGATWAFLLQSQ
ncbi:hypothetical protein A2419_03120 [Candidatus Adlerbacteria bacterium RIFOXYC1_FULL_48_26]|uniref:Uncharacterized protein n=1 Tax=Candidatus Adlerbacteria bacterium RIFOXYC1_FULL_48_26 TaxID=1797247 RepID=A0A1F4Y4F4_9BACT|nr:MAG: hypothetical protein A2419_03120 [Candidatus Adlerbacteria bacterium RIFOXYC1_FULL_48_26]OGC95151.1 MAG: hypothetical protein A2590_01885 [Candidatus Adlerbacteria bacterium RIFOXYD1_FULL_48_8]